MIFITGAARSGTSLTTRIMQALGCNLGPTNALYENLKIREKILKPYLRAIGADPLGQRNLPDTKSLIAVPKLAEKILLCIPGSEPRAYKDAKLTLVWPVFADAFPDAKWIIVRRNGDLIADSCLRTSFMSARSTRAEWRAWVAEHERRFDDMRATLDCIEVWPDHYIARHKAFAPVSEFCGLEFDPSVVSDCIDLDLWHQSESDEMDLKSVVSVFD